MSEATITIDGVETKSGTSNSGKQWTLYKIKDTAGQRYSTFDHQLGRMAQENTGKTARVTYETTDKGNNLSGLIVTNDTPTVTAPPAKTADGGADWDLIGLRKTRCALWAAFLDGGGRDTNEGRRLVMAAEADIFNREPITAVDGDIPF